MKKIFNIADIFKLENVDKYYRGDDNFFYVLKCKLPDRFEYLELYRIKWDGEELEAITDLLYLGRIFSLFFEEVSEEGVNKYFNTININA